MRLLLVNSNRFHQPWPVIPFGLCCVASAAEAAGHDVRVLDLCFSRHPAADIAGATADFRPEAVGVSIRNIDNSAGFNTRFLLEATRDEVIAPLKRAFAGPIVIGGPAVGINGAEMLDFLDLEYAIRGDGEAAFVEFLRRLGAGESMEGLGGLVVRRGGRTVQDSTPWCVEDLDALPGARPHRWMDLAPYRRCGSPLQVQTKRGCVLGCTYCTYSRIEGRSWRLRSPVLVVDEIEHLIAQTGIRDLEFTDSTFNIPLDHCKAVLREIVRRGVRACFRTMGLNPGAVDEELADLLVAAGFKEVDLGAEAGCNATLRSLGKNFRKESLLRAGRLLRERRLPVTWYLLVGAPEETPETLAETFATVNRAAGPWDLVNVGVGLRAYQGAPVAERLKSEGAVSRSEDFLRPVAVEPQGLTLAQVKAMTKREALRRANYFMYDEDEKAPLALMAAATWLLRLFRSRQPVWRLFILLRKLQAWTGVNRLRQLTFERRLRRQPAEAAACRVARRGTVMKGEADAPGPKLTGHLRALEGSLAAVSGPGHFELGGHKHVIRVANDLESRRKAYELIYRLYLEKEYAKPHPSRMWLSIFDALPETATLLVERADTGAAVGALTVVFDSPLGLPADGLYRPELDALRTSGRRLSEIVSLGVDEKAGGPDVLVRLFNCVYLLSRKVRGATDFMITVNPRHVRFYEKTLLFAPAGPERECDRVGGAPALLLRLDLGVPEERVRLEHGPGETRPARSRTLYKSFLPPGEEPDMVSSLAGSVRPMSGQEIGFFLMSKTDILARATPEQRLFIARRCPEGETLAPCARTGAP